METFMTSRLILVGVMSLALSGCALYAPSAGNPDGNAYLGHAGSTYDASVNPSNTLGVVSYSPSAPLADTTQPAVSSGAALTAPATH